MLYFRITIRINTSFSYTLSRAKVDLSLDYFISKYQERNMAIQELSSVEIEAVSGGALLNVTSLLGGLLGLVKGLVGVVGNFAVNLPIVGPLIGSVLGLVGSIISL